METPLSVYRRLRDLLGAYPPWLRVFLSPLAALMLLSPVALAWTLSDVRTAFSSGGPFCRAHKPPHRQSSARHQR